MSTPSLPEPGPAPANPVEVYDALLRWKDPEDRIDLAGAANAEAVLADLLDALKALRVANAFPLTGAQLTGRTGPVRLGAVGRYGLPGAAEANIVPVSVELVYTAPDGRGR